MNIYPLFGKIYTDLLQVGNIPDVLLKFQQPTNQHNTKELPYYFPLYTIEISVF